MKRNRWNPNILLNLRIVSRHLFVGLHWRKVFGRWFRVPYISLDRNRYWSTYLFWYAPWFQLCQIGPYETTTKYRQRDCTIERIKF